MKNLVSVVIPLYNHTVYIEKCLDSLLLQKTAGIELLLLDDGSRDNGFELAKSWEAQHCDKFARTHFERQSNAGITKTMDRLIRMAHGEFIFGLASDDVLLPDPIFALLSAFVDSKICAVFGDAIPINGNGEILGQSAIGELGVPSAREALSDPRTLLWEMIFRWNVYGSVLMTRRRYMLTENGTSILNTELFSEDMQLYYRLAGEGVLCYLDMPVAGYRMHGENISRTPENISKLRYNIYRSRQHSLRYLNFMPRSIVRLQSFTYHRWRIGAVKLLALPLVLLSYACLFVSRLFYDVFRKYVYKHKPNSKAHSDIVLDSLR